MSMPSPAFYPTRAEAAARLAALAGDGQTVPLADLPPGAPVLLTALGFGAEVWLTDFADPTMAEIDLRARKVSGAWLVVSRDGQPATLAETRARGLSPVPRIPRI